MPYFNDFWGVKSNWNSPFTTNQHLPAVQEKVTIKPTSSSWSSDNGSVIIPCIEQGTEARQPSVHQKLKCP